MNHKSHQKSTKRMKRLTTALASAAVLSSLLAPGLPIARVHAAEKPAANQPAAAPTQEQADSTAAQTRKDDGADRGRDRGHQIGDPVQVVRENAARFGFDARNDRFSLLSRTDDKAVVSVRTKKQNFKVNLSREHGRWVISAVRGIGDSNTPATYTPASMFTSYVTIPPTSTASERVLYQSNNFDRWVWYEGAYPTDMTMGVFLQSPLLRDTVNVLSQDVLNQINKVDFGRQFVLYTKLGAVAPQGYAIGIERVVQNGNDLTVTVRTKSPLANEIIAVSKTENFITLDRATLDFNNPVHINFVDQDGAVLRSYLLNRR